MLDAKHVWRKEKYPSSCLRGRQQLVTGPIYKAMGVSFVSGIAGAWRPTWCRSSARSTTKVFGNGARHRKDDRSLQRRAEPALFECKAYFNPRCKRCLCSLRDANRQLETSCKQCCASVTCCRPSVLCFTSLAWSCKGPLNQFIVCHRPRKLLCNDDEFGQGSLLRRRKVWAHVPGCGAKREVNFLGPGLFESNLKF